MDQEIKLIKLFSEIDEVDLDELSGRLGVKPRTVRERIRRANERLGSVAHIAYDRVQHSYRMEISSRDALNRMLNQGVVGTSSSIPSTMEGRASYLINDLLVRADWITLDELAKVLYVSRASVSAALAQAEGRMAKFGLTIDRRPHYGIKVEGSEANRRICLADAVLHGLRYSSDSDGSEGGVSHLFPRLADVSKCVEDALRREQFKINPVVYQNLLVHLAIAMARIRENCYMPMDMDRFGWVLSTREHDVAKTIAGDLGAKFLIELPESEVAYIAIHLAGKQLLSGVQDSGCDTSTGESAVVGGEAWDVVADMLERVKRSSHFDFSDDIELRINLAKHIVPLSVRLRYRMKIDNPLLSDIRERYTLAFAMASDGATVLTERYGVVPSDDEVGYIALAFALALERKRTELPKKSILIVCASGVGSARLLAYQYRQEFGRNLASIETCDVSSVPDYDFSDIDYVFTTVPIHCDVPVPVCQVGYFLGPQDISNVHEFMATGGYRASEGVASCFDRKLFLGSIDADSREGCLEQLCARTASVLGIQEDLFSLVWERELAAPTAFGGKVAIPHPMRPVSPKTSVAVAVLDHAIPWGTMSVQVVFLIMVANGPHDSLEEFYEGLFGVMNDAELIDDLIGHREFTRFVRKVESSGAD